MSKKTNGSLPKRKSEPEGSSSLAVITAVIERNPLLTSSQEVALAIRIQEQNDPVAKCKLVESNLRLVLNIARKKAKQYQGSCLEDLVSAGTIGLQRATERFDYKMGNRFSTYATWWIKQAMSRSLLETRIIRHPLHIAESIFKLQRQRTNLEQRLGRTPSIEELAECLKWRPDRVANLLTWSTDVTSLDMPVGEKSSVLADLIRDDKPSEFFEGLDEEVEFLLDQLPPRERQVILLRFGFVDGQTRPLAEIASIMAVTHQRVKQLERQAIVRLRQHPAAHQLLSNR